MLVTAKKHFTQDLGRAEALLSHANTLPSGELARDVLRASWMMAVGACDAYFSDAYADLIARALQAKDLEPRVAIPDRLNKLKVPVVAVLRRSKDGWRWRMAARELIESENVLSLEKISKLFNHFFRDKKRLLKEETIESWILHRDAKDRLFGVSATKYRAMAGVDKTAARKMAVERSKTRFEEVFQRRHDCIHNCDRPKTALQDISPVHVSKTLHDIGFLVSRSHEAFLEEFPEYLRSLGFAAVTRARVCQ